MTSWSRWAADKRRQAFGNPKTKHSSRSASASTVPALASPTYSRSISHDAVPITTAVGNESAVGDSGDIEVLNLPRDDDSDFENVTLSGPVDGVNESYEDEDEDDEDEDQTTYTPVSNDNINPWKGMHD